MAHSGAFVLPSGVRFSFDGTSLSIEHEGDIVIEGALDQPIRSLHSDTGSVRLGAPNLSVERVSAPAGTVSVAGRLVATAISAQRIEFTGASLKASVLKASEAIDLGGERVETDVLVAPRVDIAATTKGRATAIQSDVEVGPHKLKGGFSLGEFVNLMPGGAELLAAHDIAVPPSDEDDADADDEEPVPAPPKGRPPARAAESSPPPPQPAPALVSQITKKPSTPPPTASSIPSMPKVVPPEPSSSPELQLEPQAAPAKAPVSDDVRNQVKDAVDKIVGAYRNRELPPPIKLMVRMVEEQDYGSLKLQINTIWSDLLKYHQQTDPFISNTVSIMFQTIQLLMRKVQG